MSDIGATQRHFHFYYTYVRWFSRQWIYILNKLLLVFKSKGGDTARTGDIEIY